jgi:ABC-type amino acid transport substrate-binding protein
MRRVLALTLALLAIAAGTVVAASLERRELRVGVPANEAPFAFVGDDGAFRGFNVDLVRILCRRLGVRCGFVAISVADPAQLLQNRSVDLVPGVAITEPRRHTLDFTASYYATPGRFIVRRGRGLDVSPEGLAGQIIGVQRGTTHERYAAATYPRSTLRRYPNRSELFIDLTLGRLDAVLTNVIAGRVEFLESELGAEYDFAGPALDDPAWFGSGTGIAVRKGDEQLRGALDSALREVRADGTLDAIRSRYFGFSIE